MGTPMSDTQQKLFNDATPFVLVIARSVAKKCAHGTDWQDLYQVGLMALQKCTVRFDPAKGVKFTTYMQRRVRGEMYDDLRRSGLLTRHHTRQLKKEGKAIPIWWSMDFIPRDQQAKKQFTDYSASQEVETLEAKEELAQVLAGFNAIERDILIRYYGEGDNLKTIGRDHDLSESRISQIMSNIRARLEARYGRGGMIRDGRCNHTRKPERPRVKRQKPTTN